MTATYTERYKELCDSFPKIIYGPWLWNLTLYLVFFLKKLRPIYLLYYKAKIQI